MKKFICGSTYFFKDIEGFKSHHIDEIHIVDNGKYFNYISQSIINRRNIFKIVRRPKNELIAYALESSPANAIGKFLIPEFNEEFGITIDDLKQLKPLVDKLDESFKYEEVIYNSYIENNEFKLTDEQLMESYELYKNSRKNNFNQN